MSTSEDSRLRWREVGEKGGYYMLGIGLSIAILIGLVIMFYAYKTAPELVYENKTVAVYRLR